MKNKISPSENPSIAASRRLATPCRNPKNPQKNQITEIGEKKGRMGYFGGLNGSTVRKENEVKKLFAQFRV